jgi:DNA-binding transcriptional regulator YhcF (GntR family)
MLNKVLNTPVDNLVELVKSNKDCTISFLVQKLNLPIEVVEKWVVVLEEYKIIKVNYRGFEGYVSYVENKKDEEDEKEEAINIENLKENFIEKSKKRNLTTAQMESLWPKFISQYKSEIREIFFDMAKKRGYDSYKIAQAWNKYSEELLKF